MVAIINFLLDKLKDIGDLIITMLPKSPFTFERMAGLEQIMGYVNYFIPFGAMLKVGTAWLGCITIWYIASWVLRWAKTIE